MYQTKKAKEAWKCYALSSFYVTLDIRIAQPYRYAREEINQPTTQRNLSTSGMNVVLLSETTLNEQFDLELSGSPGSEPEKK
jgi:hypothetical protein